MLFEARGWGEEVTLPVVWDAIENIVPAGELHAAMEAVTELAPPVDADPDGEWRARLVERYRTVRGFLPLLCQVITFDAAPAATPVLEAMRALPDLVTARSTSRVPSGYLDARRADLELIPPGWWQRLALPADRPAGTVHKAGYVFCLLEQFHRLLLRRDIFAPASTRWTDPRACLLRSIDARANPKYFGRRKGATWLNLLSDRSMGLGGKVLSGTPRDSLHLIDLIYAQHGGQRPEVIITDEGSYSDVVFGLLSLLGFDYRPEIADLPDTKLWRADPAADYGSLTPILGRRA